jgi:hypothetical protein
MAANNRLSAEVPVEMSPSDVQSPGDVRDPWHGGLRGEVVSGRFHIYENAVNQELAMFAEAVSMIEKDATGTIRNSS